MEYPKEIINRLKRIEGQIRGVLRMMDEGKECTDIINQLTAIRNAVDRVSVHVIGVDLNKCLSDDLQKDLEDRDTDRIIKDALTLLLKMR
ncbi:cytoplasmic protein [Vulcanibacillus modesticaldus]|uniref:Cytoplasmic protein n=1 Tax=Vulcanibacillus modesticaldus TaxID=337097 RepID=A0A1D2YUK2_9BACI|nr:metal-sensing transcriptional repressor [Vulcanibacillus modesticaldus]OEF99335.1 cytoplasmic protein [Vulcanibacillus modesticaldus]